MADGVSRLRPARMSMVLLSLLALCVAPGCRSFAELQPSIPNGGRAVAIAVNPSDGNRMVVASETGGLFRSVDRGVRWEHVSGAATFAFTDVQYVPSDPAIVVASSQADMRTVSRGGIWRSTDAGGSWTHVAITAPTTDCTTNMAAFDVSVDATSNRLWTGTGCGIAFSDDAGMSWQYLAPAPGYNNDRTYAVVAIGGKQLKILTEAGVKVSSDGGGSWSLSTTGLPGGISIGAHNQLAVSPLNSMHLYWAFNHGGRTALFRSLDNGTMWSNVVDIQDRNRAPFVRVSTSADKSTYNVYFGDGGCTFQRAIVTHGATPSFSAWTAMNVDHCDATDVSFDTDGRTPLLLASDGGLHKTTDLGANWTLAGAGGNGYGALQITEVIGQMSTAGGVQGLYFATQDNSIWASGDEGATWPASRCCEGFFLDIWRRPIADTKFTGVSCVGCVNFISGPLFASLTAFPDPPNNAGNPRLLKPGHYIQNTRVTGVPSNIFNLTTDNGSTWTPRYGFIEDLRDLSKVAGAPNDPVVFTAVRRPGLTPDGQEILGIKRITGVIGTGAPVLSDITNFGSLGIFATMFAWYKPFGVDPADPNFFIVPDIIDDVVKVSRDGGQTWQNDMALTSLVTESGSLKFRAGPFTQISSFGFDPECRGHIMVGTIQAGMFQSFNRGDTWQKIDGTEVIPYVSSFFFSRRGEAIASSYGRGLWKVWFDCGPQIVVPNLVALEPVIFWKGAYIPISQLKNPDACPVCTWALTVGGQVLDYVIEPQSGRIEEVRLSGGELRGLNWNGGSVPLQFRISTGNGPGDFAGERALVDRLLRGDLQVKGLLVEGNLLKGVLLASADVSAAQIPQARPAEARISLNLPSGGMGIPLRSLGPIVIQGSSFEPGFPVVVSVDGQVQKLAEPTQVDAEGNFTVTITPSLGLGAHSIVVRQDTPRGMNQDVVQFNVTVGEDPEQEKKERRQ